MTLNCSIDNGGCDHKCTELYIGDRKNIQCSCQRGYKLQADGKSCIGEDLLIVNFTQGLNIHWPGGPGGTVINPFRVNNGVL